ncbi:putative u3 small nucleolar rna-associated protein 10 [Diaporthe ampelina]|uniref:U3 small nucleolar RNA-associated protein 10 n=1 Tax=Diaporthe ampelina TaxID=1214573 RepID=A0A0G2HXE7_9PEZI|nr:putative u3 small nucleolar rna-associated protein 10 [Diaporthe ampelina]
MAPSSLAAQLAQIAVNSKSTLNVKAQKAAHAKSLIFEPKVAAGQSFQTVYDICHEGFEELCRLDARFLPYEQTLFSEQSQEEDRTQMTAAENNELDKATEAFLRLVGGKLRLMPAVKAVEWLIRRFRIHEYSTSSLITTFLPYHSAPLFVTLMSILPGKLPNQYRFLDPYQHYPGLISFWGGLMTEAINGMLDLMKSGRRAVQRDHDQDLLQKLLPILSETLMMKKVPGLQIASYMVISVYASKGGLEDAVLLELMHQLVLGWSSETVRPGLVCLSILAQCRSAKQLSWRVAKSLVKVQDLDVLLQELQKEHRVDKLANGLAIALVERLTKKGEVRGLSLIKTILLAQMLSEKQLSVIIRSLLVAGHKISDEIDEDGEARKQLGQVIVALSQAPDEAGELFRKVIEEAEFDIDELELKLKASIRPKKAVKSNGEGTKALTDGAEAALAEELDLDAGLSRLSKHKKPPARTCLSSDSDPIFEELCQIFISAASDRSALLKLDEAPILDSESAPSDCFYFSFYMRIWLGPYPILARARALEMAKNRLQQPDCSKSDFQALQPYCIAALGDPAKKVRRAAAELLAVLQTNNSDIGSRKKSETPWGSQALYKAGQNPKWMTPEASRTLLEDVLIPALEESIMHEDHITAALKEALESSSKPSTDKETSKRGHISSNCSGGQNSDMTRRSTCSSLFMVLSELQTFRTLIGSELGYLQNLVLSSLLAMMPTYRDDKNLKIDTSVGHGDVLVSCIQKSSSPAVQNSALLLVASLAKTAPDVVLHSVMPIFTFMGSSVLRQSDDYSAHVINQTIREVIPPLIDTFRKGRRHLVASASELLASFVIAYEHIPSHRRQGLFVSLVENLGPQDFLFALVAMFVDKYGTSDNIQTFTADITNHFSVEIQLQTLIRFLDLVADMFKPKPNLSAAMFGKKEGDEETNKTALKQLTLLPHLLASRSLKREVGKLAERDDMETAKIRELYAQLLEDVLTVADTVKTRKALHIRCGDALSNLLNLLSVSEFIKSVETLLDRPNVGLRQKVLRALEARVDKEKQGDAQSRTALLAFLPQLTAVIRDSDDIHYKHTAVTCVDKISEKYGKKDLEAVAAAASTIAGKQCLGQDDRRLRIMALLCLASLVDVLQDGVVPILPTAIPKTLEYLSASIDGVDSDTELHDACYALMTALAQHLPYMVSGAYLDQLLVVSNKSAESPLDDDVHDNRKQCLHFLARQLDSKVLFSALQKNWASAMDAGYSAMEEFVEILGLSIDKRSKAGVAKNVSSLSAIFLAAFDLRRLENAKPRTNANKLNGLEESINEVALKMIYKLNDAAFRPIFTQIIEWSSSGLPKSDMLGITLRQQSTYGFLYKFFDSLKSIVTSYSSYVVDQAAKILQEIDIKDAEQRELWRRVLRTLTKSFEHDQDDFWQAPSHFSAIGLVLVQQFRHAPHVDLGEDLSPAVVELASAADSQEHQKELNTALLKHLQSQTAAVRLAAVKCEQDLVDKVGEEWLSMLPEMLPYISELQDDEDEVVDRETHKWIVKIEGVLGESLDSMLQ